MNKTNSKSPDVKQGCFLCKFSEPTFSYDASGIMRIKCKILGEVREKLNCPDAESIRLSLFR